MTQQQRPPEPYGDDWKTWGRRLMQFMSQTRSPLVQQTGGETAADDGTLMWDREYKYPVVSEGGEWRQIVVEGGHANFIKTSDVTPALANTVVISRTQIFTVAAGDYLEVNYMMDNTDGFLNYTAASSPVPAIPSSTLAITRTHG